MAWPNVSLNNEGLQWHCRSSCSPQSDRYPRSSRTKPSGLDMSKSRIRIEFCAMTWTIHCRKQVAAQTIAWELWIVLLQPLTSSYRRQTSSLACLIQRHQNLLFLFIKKRKLGRYLPGRTRTQASRVSCLVSLTNINICQVRRECIPACNYY